jgi:hypothetical protein
MITAKHIPWEPIATLPEDRKDGRRLLLWEIDLPAIGRWDSDRQGWEDPESMRILEDVSIGPISLRRSSNELRSRQSSEYVH